MTAEQCGLTFLSLAFAFSMTLGTAVEYLFNKLDFIHNRCIRIIRKDQRPGKQVYFLY